jgi:hypothetical protein
MKLILFSAVAVICMFASGCMFGRLVDEAGRAIGGRASTNQVDRAAP